MGSTQATFPIQNILKNVDKMQNTDECIALVYSEQLFK